MTKKKILASSLAAVLMALLLVLGSILLKPKLSPALPPVTEPATESSLPESTGEEASAAEPSSQPLSQESTSEETQESLQESSEAPSQAPTEVLSPPVPPPTTPPAEEGETDSQAQIDALIEEIYALRDYYIAQLAYLESSILAQYEALPQEEKTAEKRQELALSAIDSAYALERECDGRMDEACTRLSYLLLQSNGDMSLINRVRYAYASEKEQAKRAFLEKYADYFG